MEKSKMVAAGMENKVREAAVGQPVLVYDGECPVCSRAVRWLKNNIDQRSFEMLPYQSYDLDIRFPFLKQEELMKEIHLIFQDGTVVSGSDTFPVIANKLKRHPVMSILFKLPGALFMNRILYRWFAPRRYSIANFFTFPYSRKMKEDVNTPER
jgi:predicted DCC family thiol-disulfide oxidoreductase YuxK